MKRNLNENAESNYNGIKICVSEIRKDDPELDCNKLRDIFVKNGATVTGSHGLYREEPATFMTVSNLMEYDVIDILNDFLGESEYAATAVSYIVSDDVDTTYTLNPEKPEFPAYEDVELDPENDALYDEALLEGDNILDDAKDELRGVLAKVEDEIYLSDEGIVLDTILSNDNLVVYSISANGDMDTDEEELVNAFDLTDADDIFTLCDVIKDALDSEYPAYDDVDDDEEYTPRVEKMKPHRHLVEKKKDDCCPGTKPVNEAEAIDAVLHDIDQQILNEAEEVNRKKEQKLNIKVLNAINERKHSLYPNISYNGKSFDKMTIKELKRIYENVSATVEELKNKSLNESVVDQKTLDTIDKKNQLLEYVDNEITYRTTLVECMKKLNEDGAEISDEELKNLFGPAQGEEATPDNTENTEDSNSDENKSKENSDENKEDNNSAEEGEVVEISRVVITLKDAEAANDLKQACIEAEIPEDAFELENVDEESATEDENSDENKSEENSEDNNNSEESSDENSENNNSEENANESYEYAKYVQMLAEGEFGFDQSSEEGGNEENGEEQSAENDEENPDENSDENSDENNEDDKQPKFILTNTDYISTLAKVLDNVYGISKEEFEDMIGGPIVEDEDNDENSDENKGDENKEESSDENSDDNEEEIDPSDLFKNL